MTDYTVICHDNSHSPTLLGTPKFGYLWRGKTMSEKQPIHEEFNTPVDRLLAAKDAEIARFREALEFWLECETDHDDVNDDLHGSVVLRNVITNQPEACPVCVARAALRGEEIKSKA